MTKYLTEDQIVDDLFDKIQRENGSYESWTVITRDQLIEGHHTTGRNIRNTYHLWDKNNPYVGQEHPDDISMRIMEKVWDKLNG